MIFYLVYPISRADNLDTCHYGFFTRVYVFTTTVEIRIYKIIVALIYFLFSRIERETYSIRFDATQLPVSVFIIM